MPCAWVDCTKFIWHGVCSWGGGGGGEVTILGGMLQG